MFIDYGNMHNFLNTFFEKKKVNFGLFLKKNQVLKKAKVDTFAKFENALTIIIVSPKILIVIL